MESSTGRSFRTATFLLAALALTACGGVPQPGSSRPDDGFASVQPNLSAGDSVALGLTAGGGAYVIAVPRARAWSAIPAAYAALALKLTQQDASEFAVVGERERSRQTFGGHSWVSLLDCGEIAGVPNAARYEITMQVETQLRAEGPDSTIVASRAIAAATPAATAGGQLRCTVHDGVPRTIARAVLDAAEGTRRQP